MLAVTAHFCSHIPAPIHRTDAGRHITMERGVRTIGYPFGVTQFQGVRVHIVQVVAEIGCITQQVLRAACVRLRYANRTYAGWQVRQLANF